jgi:hypothetical protein
VHGLRAHAFHDDGDLAHPLAPPHDQRAAELTQRVVEIVQRFEEEAGAVGPVVRAAENGVVEDEERHDALGLPDGPRERRMVVDAQIACEHDHRHRPHGGTIPSGQPSDSIVSEYGKYCDGMLECRNLGQLTSFVATIADG